MMKVNILVFFLVLITVSSSWFYFEVHVAGLVLPNFWPLLFSLFYVILRPSDVKVYLNTFLIGIISLSLAVLSGYYFSNFTDISIGIIQVSLSFFVFAVLVVILNDISSLVFYKVVKSLLFFVVFFGLLERVGLTTEINNTFRDFFYAKSLYTSSFRDIAQYGFVRPTIFTKEPAHAAMLLSMFSALYIIMTPSFRLLKALLLFVVGYFLIRSPVVALILIVYFALWVFEQENIKKQILYSLASVLGAFLVLFIVSHTFSERFEYAMSGEDFSATNRILGIPLIIYEVLKSNFLFGLGVTNDVHISEYVSKVFINLGFDWRVEQFDGDSISKRVTNFFAQILIYFGVLGGVGYLSIFFFFLKRYSTPKIAINSLLCFLLFSLGMGGAVTPKVWVLLALIFMAFKVKDDNLYLMQR